MLMVSGALLVAAAAQAGAQAIVQPGGTDRTVASSRATRAPAVLPLDRRVALLVRELDLDATQQVKVKAVLEGQREQILRVWQDESVPGALRVARTQAITERTEDGIRALLTDAQRQKYFKPRTDRGAIGGTPDDLANYVDKMDRR